MILLTPQEIVTIHAKLIEKTGGSDGIRDRGLLESAVYGAQASFDEVEQYPTAPEKAAWLAFALIQNHAFVDGNKRIGVFVMLMTLKLNRVAIRYSQKELIDLGLGIASGNLKYQQILEWLQEHLC